MNNNNHPIAIIGGGPAGLIAAETLAETGQQVVVYERKPSLGRKFLMAGRGGLNLTHSEGMDKFLARYGDAEDLLTPIIKNFSPDDLRQWCEGLGQETFIGSSGRIFPKTMKASPLLRAWIARLEKLGVQFRMQKTWTGWNEKYELTFINAQGISESMAPSATLLALGGASWPNLGSDGAWVPLLQHSGVEITSLQPANSGFVVAWSDYIKKHAGEPLKAVSLHLDHEESTGDLMISEKGIEGGAVYALSSVIRETINKHGHAELLIDLRPGQTAKELIDRLKNPRGRQSFSTYLQKSLNLSPLHISLLREANKTMQDLQLPELAALIKNVPVTVSAPFPIERSISSAGGISFDALDKNMMIKNMPGIFAAGEMLDWEAPTGGYLLQATFATGRAAALGILNWLKT